MAKIDLKKSLSECYTAKGSVKLVEVPPITYICYEGKGDPNTSADFQQAMAVLYGLAYTIKFLCKADGRDFTVMPLEAQWWTDNPADYSELKKERWRWKVMIAVPDFVDEEMVSVARTQLEEKKGLPCVDRATLERMSDGLSAQYLHVGSYSEEGTGIAIMHREVEARGYRLRGRHREIYMGNPQRTEPEKLKTIIRQPIEKQ